MSVTHCSVCHRLLTDPYSIRLGVGPECRGKMVKHGYRFPKPVYKVKDGHVEFMGMTGKLVEPEKVKDEKEELVRRVFAESGSHMDAVQALYDYMADQDSLMGWRWCERFVDKVMKEMQDENNDQSD